MDKFTDEQLMAKIQKGNMAAFTCLLERYQKELYNFLVRFIRKPGLAEDLFQETFLQVHLAAPSFDTARRFRPWLYTIASNKARDLLRSQSRRPTVNLTPDSQLHEGENLWDYLLTEEMTPADILEQKNKEQLVKQTVTQLPDHLREILILSYFQQLPYKEIAEVLDIPLGTVKSRLHSAVAAFAKQFKQNSSQTEWTVS